MPVSRAPLSPAGAVEDVGLAVVPITVFGILSGILCGIGELTASEPEPEQCDGCGSDGANCDRSGRVGVVRAVVSRSSRRRCERAIFLFFYFLCVQLFRKTLEYLHISRYRTGSHASSSDPQTYWARIRALMNTSRSVPPCQHDAYRCSRDVERRR